MSFPLIVFEVLIIVLLFEFVEFLLSVLLFELLLPELLKLISSKSSNLFFENKIMGNFLLRKIHYQFQYLLLLFEYHFEYFH